MPEVNVLLLWIAVACFVIAGVATVANGSTGRFNAVAWGLAAFAGSFLASL